MKLLQVSVLSGSISEPANDEDYDAVWFSVYLPWFGMELALGKKKK
jgi:hypothetical protein